MSDTPPTGPGPENEPKPTDPAAAGATPAGDPASKPAPVEGMGDPADVEKNKVMALLAYIGILWLVPLLAAKESPFARYHTNQGLILFLAMIVVGIVFGILATVLGFIAGLVTHGVGSCVFCVCLPLPEIAYLACAIIGILNAVNGKMKPLPGIPDSLKIIK